MKILRFNMNEQVLTLVQNQASLSDTIRMAFYNENESLFELLDYEDDFTFLEPSLFCYFLSDVNKENKISLEQSVLGYLPKAKRPQSILLIADQFGLINLPNLGYLRANPCEQLTLSSEEIQQKIESNLYFRNTKIRLCLHPTDHLSYEESMLFDESTEQTFLKNKKALHQAVAIFQTQIPDFWKLIEDTTREFVVFSSSNHNSFAGIMQHGTAYFNVENKLQTPVFFIDDIAHQCGHVIFNALTLNTNDYLKVPKDQDLAGFIESPNETRGVYGAFHGLFTYTCILHSLDSVLSIGFEEDLRHEALGRMGFYTSKFGYDIQLMNNSDILTENGFKFLEQFAESCHYIIQKYGAEIKNLDFSNQPYMFQYDLFKAINPILNPISA
jgi:hypothetical protein